MNWIIGDGNIEIIDEQDFYTVRDYGWLKLGKIWKNGTDMEREFDAGINPIDAGWEDGMGNQLSYYGWGVDEFFKRLIAFIDMELKDETLTLLELDGVILDMIDIQNAGRTGLDYYYENESIERKDVRDILESSNIAYKLIEGDNNNPEEGIIVDIEILTPFDLSTQNIHDIDYENLMVKYIGTYIY